MIRLVYAPDLVEESVLQAERDMPAQQRRAFRRERNRLYELADRDEREKQFRACHRRWFVSLGLDRVVEQAILGCPDLADRQLEARIVASVARREEGADLVDCVVPGRDIQPLLVIRLRPSTLLDPSATRALLRHELTHVADMLDPSFGYERTLLPSDDGPLADNIVRDRYRVLWDVTIDGRLARAGAGGDGVRNARWQEFEAAFPMLEGRARASFDEWFDHIRPTHAALAAFAQTPAESVGRSLGPS